MTKLEDFLRCRDDAIKAGCRLMWERFGTDENGLPFFKGRFIGPAGEEFVMGLGYKAPPTTGD